MLIMSSFQCLVSVILSSSFQSVLSELTRSRFEEFRLEIIELASCGGADCTELSPGLTATHPDVSLYDLDGNPGIDADLNMIGGITRLAFHDCVELNINKVKSGNTNFFTDPHTNGEAGGCNGCIGINNPENDNLLDAAIDPLQAICDDYTSDGMSRADCWALAATITLEWSAAKLADSRGPPFFQIIDPSIVEGDIPYYYGRSDCNNGYDPESDIVAYPFSNPDGVFFEFPDPTLGWSHMTDFFKSRFGWNNKKDYFTNRDIISLISGGHSVGRGHEKITGFPGMWDFTVDVLDNAFISTLFGEDFVISSPAFGINQNLAQSIRNPNEPNNKAAFHMTAPPHIITAFRFDQPPFDPVFDKLLQSLNTDFSMVYDISYYIENDKTGEIDCVSRADLVCDENQIILTAPRGTMSNFNKHKTGQELGEQYECGEGEDCCEFIQCPIQCEGGIAEYNRLVNNDLIDTVDDTSNCPAAIAKKYSMRNQQDTIQQNRYLGVDFAKSFTKMITIGYVDKHSGEVLLKTVPDAVSNGDVVIEIPPTTIYIIAAFVCLLLLVNISYLCYTQCCLRKKAVKYAKVSQVVSSDDDMQNLKEYQM